MKIKTFLMAAENAYANPYANTHPFRGGMIAGLYSIKC